MLNDDFFILPRTRHHVKLTNDVGFATPFYHYYSLELEIGNRGVLSTGGKVPTYSHNYIDLFLGLAVQPGLLSTITNTA